MHDTIRFRALLVLLTLPLALPGCSTGADDDTGSTGTATGTSVTTVTPGDTDTSGETPTTSGASTGEATDSGVTSTSGTTGGATDSEATDPSAGSTTIPDPTTGDTSTGDATDTAETTMTTGGNGLWDKPNLWYAVDDALIYIEIDPMDGSVVQLVHNQLVSDVPLWHGQNGLTMLEDGTLLGSRETVEGTQIYHVPAPSTTQDTPAAAVLLGTVPGKEPNDPPPRIEALYTDCDGRIYLMDTGKDVGSVEGNRLLRFNGKYLAGELTFDVITDLGNASVADIDDMSPGLVDGEISDGLGFAMDSNDLWKIDYTTGTGTKLATTPGTWGIHALGGPLFADMTARVYILSSDARLREVALDDYSSSEPLVVGPDLQLDSGFNGWSGLAGPLTECMTTIPQ